MTARVLQHDFQSSVGYWTCTTAHLIERAINDELLPHGITYRQWQVLAWLALEGPLAQTELAQRMKIEPPTLVGVLDRMERDGLLIRESCPEDRRKRMIHPLPQAEPVWNLIVAGTERVRAKATRGLTAEQVETLITLLRVVQANLQEGMPAGAPAAEESSA
jgi:MarR family transcriptional regulator for hemolysin